MDLAVYHRVKADFHMIAVIAVIAAIAAIVAIATEKVEQSFRLPVSI